MRVCCKCYFFSKTHERIFDQKTHKFDCFFLSGKRDPDYHPQTDYKKIQKISKPEQDRKVILELDKMLEEVEKMKKIMAKFPVAEHNYKPHPDALKEGTKLYEYQEIGVKAMFQHIHAAFPLFILADEPGLGKTLQCAAFFAHTAKGCTTYRNPKIMVVLPKTLVEVWKEECKKWTNLRVQHVPFDRDERVCLLVGAEK